MRSRTSARLALVLALAAVFPGVLHAQGVATGSQEEPYIVEYYYKVRWGSQQEFLQLFRKNHLPVLEAERKAGRIREIRMEEPRYHATEEGRWDLRVTLVYPSLAVYGAPGLSDAELRRLYPDQATFEREERRRFETLIAHWDVPVMPVRAP